jgi:hypothetical protein
VTQLFSQLLSLPKDYDFFDYSSMTWSAVYFAISLAVHCSHSITSPSVYVGRPRLNHLMLKNSQKWSSFYLLTLDLLDPDVNMNELNQDILLPSGLTKSHNSLRLVCVLFLLLPPPPPPPHAHICGHRRSEFNDSSSAMGMCLHGRNHCCPPIPVLVFSSAVLCYETSD